MTSNDQQKKGFFPFMKMPKLKSSSSDFDEKCADLEDCISKVYNFFIWYGSRTKSRHDELRSILFLECLFLQILVDIKDIFSMRGKQLYDERTNKFKGLLELLNKNMRMGSHFIRRSNNCLMEELNSKTSYIALMRWDVVEGFRNLSPWLRFEIEKPVNKERCRMLADELGLIYQMKLFGCVGDSFEQHTNMVLNGLMLLAIPSMPDTLSDDFCTLFDNSIAELKDSKSWKWSFESWKKKINMEYDLNDIVEDKDKVVYLKDMWKALDEQEESFLNQFGIIADNTRSSKERAIMAFRIFKHLNTEDLDDSPRMSMEELQHYLLIVSQKQWLDDEIERRKPHLKKPDPPGKKIKKKLLFKPDVNLEYLKGCMNMVYNRFFIDEKKETLEGDKNDLITIMVYLYIICEAEGYFEDNYKDSNKTAFFKFCTEKVGFEDTKSDRTFRNRFDDLKDVYIKYCQKKDIKLNEKTEKDYRKILAIFHGKNIFNKLRRDMSG